MHQRLHAVGTCSRRGSHFSGAPRRRPTAYCAGLRLNRVVKCPCVQAVVRGHTSIQAPHLKIQYDLAGRILGISSGSKLTIQVEGLNGSAEQVRRGCIAATARIPSCSALRRPSRAGVRSVPMRLRGLPSECGCSSAAWRSRCERGSSRCARSSRGFARCPTWTCPASTTSGSRPRAG